MSLDTSEIRLEQLPDTAHLGCRQRGLLRQWRSFFARLRRGLQSGDEYAVVHHESQAVQLIASILFLTRYHCLWV